jgi:hypothetical protein
LFDQSLKLEQKYPALAGMPHAVLWLKSSAHAQRAAAFAVSNCTEARKHFAEALTLLASPLRALDLEQLRSNIQTQRQSGIGGVTECTPV